MIHQESTNHTHWNKGVMYKHSLSSQEVECPREKEKGKKPPNYNKAWDA